MVTVIRAYTTSFCDLYSKHISVLRHFQYYVITHFAYMLVPRSDALLVTAGDVKHLFSSVMTS